MTTGDVEEAILHAMRQANLARTPEAQIAVAPDAVLYGAGSALDSLGLVSLLIDIEDALRERGIDIMLSDERAMSQKRSPFRSVPALVEFICDTVAATAR